MNDLNEFQEFQNALHLLMPEPEVRPLPDPVEMTETKLMSLVEQLGERGMEGNKAHADITRPFLLWMAEADNWIVRYQKSEIDKDTLLCNLKRLLRIG